MKTAKRMLVVIMAIMMVLVATTACSPGDTPAPSGGGESQATDKPGGETTPSAPPAEKETVWRFVSAFVPAAAEHHGIWMFIEQVNEELAGRLKIDYLGGTEIVAYFDQFEQCGQGVFELAHVPVNMTANIVPTGDALFLTELNPMEMRASGAYDKMKENYEKQGNVTYLGVTSGEGYGYTIYTNFEVPSLDVFKGKTIRTAPVFVPLLTELGAGSVSIGAGEVYQAVERGVVDGYGWSTIGVMDYAWNEVTKYRIEPAFYPCNVGMYVNTDAFNALSADLQAEVLRIAEEVEEKCYGEMGAMNDDELKQQLEGGMELIVLEGAMREEWLTTAREAGWDSLNKKDAAGAAEIRPLVTKP